MPRVNKYGYAPEDLAKRPRDLHRMLELVQLAFYHSKSARDISAFGVPYQIELELNRNAMLSTIYWIQMRLEGTDPHQTPLKIALEQIKESMLVLQIMKDGVKKEEEIAFIEDLFEAIYGV